MPERETPSNNSDFYVGYLPASAAVKRLARICALIPIVALIALAAALATSRRDPGTADWNTASAQTFTGVVQAAPYPMIHLTQAAGPLPVGSTLLIVEMGKYGGGQRAAPLDGRIANLSGYLLQRDGRTMIELEDGEKALADSGQIQVQPADVRIGPVEYSGEIVDSKCFLGAMKPGDGHVHRECAMLCIAGGIPPTLIVNDQFGQHRYMVLADTSGKALSKEIVPKVGIPVSVKGTLFRRGDLLILQTSIDAITPSHQSSSAEN